MDAPPIANAAEPKTVWRRNDRREICRTHLSTSALKRAQDRLRRKLTTEECRQVKSDDLRRLEEALFSPAGAGEQFVQPCFATIGGVAMNDAALGSFVERRNQSANLFWVGLVCAARAFLQTTEARADAAVLIRARE